MSLNSTSPLSIGISLASGLSLTSTAALVISFTRSMLAEALTQEPIMLLRLLRGTIILYIYLAKRVSSPTVKATVGPTMRLVP